jgi:galactose mutarotase-like enzyme
MTSAPLFKSHRNENFIVNGQAAVELTHQPKTDLSTPHFLKAVLLPGRGMNTFQLQSYLPGYGVFDVFETLSSIDAKEMFLQDDPFGNLSFKCGGAFLIPYGNRIRGPLNPDGQTLQAKNIMGRTLDLPANWKGVNPDAELHAMHGLILKSQVVVDRLVQTETEAVVHASLEAADFGWKWPSQTELKFRFTLQEKKFSVWIQAQNVGEEETPIGIGWHPYFAFPSGKREQVRLEIPASQRALSNNLDDVFPTGEIVNVAGSEYDHSAPGGRALGSTFYDDSFLDFKKNENNLVTVKLTDPLAGYGVQVRASSPPITNFQFYAPPDKAFTSIEPQVNMPEPFAPLWSDEVDRGMQRLKPGQSFVYAIEVELFTPVKA